MKTKLLETLYDNFKESKNGLEKFIKHTKLLLQEGDITDQDIKTFFNNIKLDNTKTTSSSDRCYNAPTRSSC